ncbi:peptidoglycan recognition protein family protein [Latilactobacillus fuchuensis]|uniref:Teichoic acid-binding N-acetylmuramoyl L-alalanine amidase (Cell wall hydrolase) n=2 Tax=Latilactobacillus fuchuensis TaxID=164393 RepID=A0A2N9DX37_9LACO|nr:hypothetical protein FC69_GL000489 [Latilactobacillus fuchuensis DSM 14340 = JCM 11249]SPC39246.1 putative teichoic acid-binding N-acetylmuramoyl L-alalanine amidase (Cell wall hydrolase) [Latilactobacillus fuchuensis]
MNKKKISLLMFSSIILTQLGAIQNVSATEVSNNSQKNAEQIPSSQVGTSSTASESSNSVNSASKANSQSSNQNTDSQKRSQIQSTSRSSQTTSKVETQTANQISTLSNIVNFKSTVKVKNQQGSHLINEKTGAITKSLGFKTSWLTSKKATDSKGQTWYKVSGNEYISAKDVYVKGTNMLGTPTTFKQVVKIKAGNGSALVSSTGNVSRTLSNGSRWKTFQKVSDVFGEEWYKVGTNAYVRASDCYLEGQSIFKNPQAINKVTITIVNSNGGNLVKDDGEITGKLKFKSNWLTSKTVVNNAGVLYYKVSRNEYVSSADVKVVNDETQKINNFQAQNGIITILNKNGAKTTTQTGNKNGELKYTSRWKYSSIGTDIYGIKWYRVGTNQYVSSADSTTQNENMFQQVQAYNTVLMVSNYKGAVIKDSFNNKGKTLPIYSSWQITQKAIDKTGGVWYRVGTNQYVSATDMHAKTISVNKDMIAGLPNNHSSNEIIVAHESGTPAEANNPNALENEIAYMKNHWTSAYVTHWVGHGGKIVQTAPVGQMSWGCGPTGNAKAFAQVELARTNNKATFNKDYQSYVRLLRFLADQAGISYKLDQGGKGIKTHSWISNTYHEVDHTDPYGYLQSMGISKAQFAKDLANGI